MAESRPRQGKRGLGRAVWMAAVALLGLVAAPSYADLRPPARPRVPPPMRFVRVTSADPACKPDCPQWLSAEGRIGRGSATDFAQALERLDGRRLPILIHSPGGSVPDAAAMGRTHPRQGSRGRGRQDADRQLPGKRAEMPGRPGQGDHRRSSLRLGLRACARGRNRTPRRPLGADRGASDHHPGERDRRLGSTSNRRESFTSSRGSTRRSRPISPPWASANRR